MFEKEGNDNLKGNEKPTRKLQRASHKPGSSQNAQAFFQASKSGDARRLTNLLNKNPTLNVNTKDPTGHSPLRLAVKNNHIDVVEQLIERCHPANIYEALMMSISLGYDNITELFLKSDKYEAVKLFVKETIQGVQEKSTKSDEEEDDDDYTPDDSLVSSDITPIILASQKNQFDIVQMLLDLGDQIDVPHDYYCQCKVCRGASSFDELRFAKTRLNTYKGLASESYISLSSKDPILTAFQLRAKLKQLGDIEKYFRTDYAKLASHLTDYVMRLLDKVRDGDELEVVLNEETGTSFVAYDRLARLKLALFYHEKKFVAHASCQKRLTSIWYGEIHSLERMPAWLMIPTLLLLLIAYPFLAIIFWIYPWGRVGNLLRTPVIKFYANAMSYGVFIAILIAHTAMAKASMGQQLTDHPEIGPLYKQYLNNCAEAGMQPSVGNVFIRYYGFDRVTIVLCVWVAGLVWQTVKKVYTERLKAFLESWYNISDVIMLIMYITSFVLVLFTNTQVKDSLDNFSNDDGWSLLMAGDDQMVKATYWLSADRYNWDLWDPGLVSDALFAVANVISVTRMTYILAVSERLGPLIISLARMIIDVFAFMSIFLLVMIAFVIGFRNLYWYYSPQVRQTAEINQVIQEDSILAEAAFGNFERIFRTVYWSIFGMTDYDSVELGDYGQGITSIVGEILFGIYNWIIIIILINMLIAMMARSYETIAAEEDMEWKFSRSKLYLEYIRDGGTLCVPFNMVPTWKSVFYGLRAFCRALCPSCCSTETSSLDNKKSKNIQSNTNENDNTPDTASEVFSSIQDISSSSSTKSTKRNKEASQYEITIGRIVKRYVLSHGSGDAEDSELELLESQMADLKKDLSNLRYEMVTRLRRQDEAHDTTHQKVMQVESAVDEAEKSLAEIYQQGIMQQQESLQSLQEQLQELRQQIEQFLYGTEQLTVEVQRNVAAMLERLIHVETQVMQLTGSGAQIRSKVISAPRMESTGRVASPPVSIGHTAGVTQYGTLWRKSTSSSTSEKSGQGSTDATHSNTTASEATVFAAKSTSDSERANMAS